MNTSLTVLPTCYVKRTLTPASPPPKPVLFSSCEPYGGGYSGQAIRDVLDHDYKIAPSCLRKGSKYSFTGLEILARLEEACGDQHGGFLGWFQQAFPKGVCVRSVAMSPRITKDIPSLLAIQKGLKDLCQVGLAIETHPGRYLITNWGRQYSLMNDSEDLEDL